MSTRANISFENVDFDCKQVGHKVVAQLEINTLSRKVLAAGTI